MFLTERCNSWSQIVEHLRFYIVFRAGLNNKRFVDSKNISFIRHADKKSVVCNDFDQSIDLVKSPSLTWHNQWNAYCFVNKIETILYSKRPAVCFVINSSRDRMFLPSEFYLTFPSLLTSFLRRFNRLSKPKTNVILSLCSI